MMAAAAAVIRAAQMTPPCASGPGRTVDQVRVDQPRSLPQRSLRRSLRGRRFWSLTGADGTGSAVEDTATPSLTHWDVNVDTRRSSAALFRSTLLGRRISRGTGAV